MTLDEIRELIQLLKETGVAELEVQRGDNRVRIRRSMPGGTQEFLVPAETPSRNAEPVQTAAVASSGRQDTPPAPSTEPGADPSLTLIKSPIVGTFYESASPGSPPFVRVGEKVQPGKVLCIIESMKLMNEIEAEVAGVVESKLVPNGQPVEYGEALFAIRPL